MRRHLHVIAALLFVLALGYDFWLWGGLAKAPPMGAVVTDAAARELALATVYVPAGIALLDLSGLSAAAAMHAAATFAPVQAALLANPAAGMDTLLAEMPLVARLAYHGAPLLLVLFLLSYWLRPRAVHSAISRRG